MKDIPLRLNQASRPSICTSCGADLIWVQMRHSGKWMALSARSLEKRIVRTGLRHIQAEVMDTYVSHFIECPDPDAHRDKKKGSRFQDLGRLLGTLKVYKK